MNLTYKAAPQAIWSDVKRMTFSITWLLLERKILAKKWEKKVNSAQHKNVEIFFKSIMFSFQLWPNTISDRLIDWLDKTYNTKILSANMGEMHKTQKTVSLIILLLLVLRVEEDYGPHRTRLVFM